MGKYIEITAYAMPENGSVQKYDDVLVDKNQAFVKVNDNVIKTETPVWRDAETGWALFENAEIVDIEVFDYSGKAYKSRSANGFIYIPVSEKEKLS